MKTLIAYRSRYGCTRRYAELLAAKLDGEVTIADLGRPPLPSPDGFDRVLLGSPIYAGSIPAGVTRFCERHRRQLQRVPVGLFICCLYEGQKARAQLDSAFPEWLSLHAFGRWALGGELHQARLRFLDRLLIRALGRGAGEVSRFRPEDLEPILRQVERLAP